MHAFRFPVPPPPKRSGAVELHGSISFKENLCRFSAGSFKVIIFGKLLRFNDSYGVSCLTAATQMQLFWRTLYSLMSRRYAPDRSNSDVTNTSNMLQCW